MADSLIWHDHLLPSIFYHISVSVTQYVGTSSFGIMWYSIREYQHAAIQICGQSARSDISPHERRDPHRHLCTGWTVVNCTLSVPWQAKGGSLAYVTGLDNVCSVSHDCQRALLASLPQSYCEGSWRRESTSWRMPSRINPSSLTKDSLIVQ